MNFTGYLAKLSEYMEQVSNYCPRLEQYKEIFNGFPRFRDAVDNFYAIVIVFCTEALKIVQQKGSIYLIFPFFYQKDLYLHLPRYIQAYSSWVWLAQSPRRKAMVTISYRLQTLRQALLVFCHGWICSLTAKSSKRKIRDR